MLSIVTGEKSKISREKGITLIALVVTIIVLLILAGVSIQMLTGQNGILKRAQEASEKTKRAEVIEEVQMEIYDMQVTEDGKITAKELHDILDEYFENVPELDENGTWEDYPDNFENPLVSKEDKKIEVEIGEIYKGALCDVKKRVTSEEVVDNLKWYMGAYINYGVELDGNPNTPDWRIFYAQNVEGENRIYLIAADYVPTDNAALVDAMGEGTSKAMMTKYTESEYSNLCATWANSEPSNLQPITLENWKNIFKDGNYELNEEYENSKCVARLRETTNWEKFAEGTGGEYAIGGPTAQMWCAAWNTIIPTGGKIEGEDTYQQITADVIDTYGYKYTSGSTTLNWMYINATQTQLKVRTDDTYSIFFPHTTMTDITANGKTGNCYGYWGTSTSAESSNHLMHINCSCAITYGPYYDRLGVRPVVSLTSNIRLTESGKTLKGKPVYDIALKT